MRQLVEHSIASHRLIQEGDVVLVGVSGGADSVALAYVLHYLQSKIGNSLFLAHLHHSMRGGDADRDRDLVFELAAKLNLPLCLHRRNVPELAESRGISLEMAAREARYEFFLRECHRLGADKVAVAHNADDQAETVLLRLARGAGTRGLAAMAPSREMGDITIIRPMLEVAHKQALEFLGSHGLKWREDKSNSELFFLRNRVRHKIIPLMEQELNPNVRGALCRAADILHDEDDYLHAETVSALEQVRDPSEGGVEVASLWNCHRAIRRRALLIWLHESNVAPENADFAAIERIEWICRSLEGSQSVDIGAGWKVQRSYGKLSLVRSEDSSAFRRTALEVPGRTTLDSIGLIVTAEWGWGWVEDCGEGVGSVPAMVAVDADRVGGAQIYARPWKAGDSMHPYGMGGHKKLQDIFTDEKVPAQNRKSIPVFECRGEIVWIPGYRVSADWIVPSREADSIRMEVEPLS